MKAFKFILVILSVFLFGYLQNNAQSVISRQTNTQKKQVSSQNRTPKKSKQLGSNSHINSNPAKAKSKETPITISDPDGYINGHGYVDLGLPSGTKWATCNIGSVSPEDNGNYYAWGETYTKSVYIYSTWRTNDVGGVENSEKTITEKICEICDGKNLKPLYDAASVNWGSLWRMPTSGEMTELCEKCIWNWITYKGKKGYKVVGPNGNTIFLPAAGYYFDTTLEMNDKMGCYWSSTFESISFTFYVYFREDYKPCCSAYGERTNGYSVRPVVN